MAPIIPALTGRGCILPVREGTWKRLARFTFNLIVKHLRMQSPILQRGITMPASKAVRLLSTARYGSVRLQPEVVYFKKPGGNLKENLQKGGYRDFSRKILPLPRLAAYPTLTAQSTTSAPTAI